MIAPCQVAAENLVHRVDMVENPPEQDPIIGSLYQCFPTKEALVVALVARHNREMLELLEVALEEVASLDLPSAIRRLAGAMIEAHEVDPELHRVCDEQIPRIGRLAEIEAIEQKIFGLVRTYLEGHRHEIRVRDLGTATFICVTTVETLTHRAVIRAAEGCGDGLAEIEEEIVRLILGYLQSPE